MGRHHDKKSRGESSRSSNHDQHSSKHGNSHKERDSKRHRKSRYESDSDSEDSTEKQRIRDLKERDEFADRLKKKDQDKTRNVAQPSGSGKYILGGSMAVDCSMQFSGS